MISQHPVGCDNRSDLTLSCSINEFTLIDSLAKQGLRRTQCKSHNDTDSFYYIDIPNNSFKRLLGIMSCTKFVMTV